MSFKKAYQQAIILLAKRDYSRKKLTHKLLLKGFNINDIDEALERLIKEKLFKEDIYIEARILAFMRKGLSPQMILKRLKAEGVETKIQNIQSIFSNNNSSSLKQIQMLINKKSKSFSPSDPKRYEKLYRYLIGKGHSHDQISHSLSQNDIFHDFNARVLE